MATEITPFAFGDNMVRVRMDENGEPWFVAKDVCRVLGLENNREAVSGLDDDEKSSVRISDGSSPQGGNPNMTVISLTAGQLISAVKTWWKDHGKGDASTSKTIGMAIGRVYGNKRKSNGSVYLGVRFKNTGEVRPRAR